MKALLDTNSLVSVLLRPDGEQSDFSTLAGRSASGWPSSPNILAELADVLHRRHIFAKYQLT